MTTKNNGPLYCLRCARQYPFDAKLCDCTPDGIELKSRNHPDQVRELCEKNIKFAYWMANKFKHKFSAYSDLESYAMEGLLLAAMYFRTDVNVKFTSFAGICIVQCIRRRLAPYRRREIVSVGFDDIGDDIEANFALAVDEVDQERLGVADEVRQAIRALPSSLDQYVISQYYFRGKTLGQIARASGSFVVDIYDAWKRAVCTLRMELSERFTLTGQDQSAWQSKFFGLTVPVGERDRFTEATRSKLLGIERFCVCRHFVDGKTLTAIGQDLGRTSGEVRTIVDTGIDKLRPFVNFDSESHEAKQQDDASRLCSRCGVGRPMRTSRKRLCRDCGRIAKSQLADGAIELSAHATEQDE